MGEMYTRINLSADKYLEEGTSILVKCMIRRLKTAFKDSDFYQKIRIYDTTYHAQENRTITIKAMQTVDVCVVKENCSTFTTSIHWLIKTEDVKNHLTAQEYSLLEAVARMESSPKMKPGSVEPVKGENPLEKLTPNIYQPVTEEQFSEIPGTANTQKLIGKIKSAFASEIGAVTILYKPFHGRNGKLAHYTRVLDESGMLISNVKEYNRNGKTYFEQTPQFLNCVKETKERLLQANAEGEFKPFEIEYKDTDGYSLKASFNKQEDVRRALAMIVSLSTSGNPLVLG